MKPFDLELAKKGHPVCTRDGCKVRILCFDRKDKNYPICALIDDGEIELLRLYTNSGHLTVGDTNNKNLMMDSEKKDGWINVYQCGVSYPIYKSKEEAQNSMVNGIGLGKYITTIKIEWEE